MTEPDIPKHTTAHPDMDPPTFPQQIMHTVPTNTEILTDTDLFNTHISKIDNALNIYPFPSKSASPQKETTPCVDHPMISSSDHAHKIPLTTQSCDNQLFDTPVMHVQDNIHMPFHGPKKKLDPAQGTWKRLGPPPVETKIKPEDKAMDPKHNSPSAGPKRKSVEQSHAHATSIDKKQKLEDDPRTLKNFETDNLG
nr:hypothetical protein CFP56_53082 [Quercus suber]POF08598.1 hypothetical protein CFP56_53084 [Quercus suber]